MAVIDRIRVRAKRRSEPWKKLTVQWFGVVVDGGGDRPGKVISDVERLLVVSRVQRNLPVLVGLFVGILGPFDVETSSLS